MRTKKELRIPRKYSTICYIFSSDYEHEHEPWAGNYSSSGKYAKGTFELYVNSLKNKEWRALRRFHHKSEREWLGMMPDGAVLLPDTQHKVHHLL